LELHAQTQTIHSTAAISREMFGLALRALVSGTACAVVAGGLVVLLAINNS